MKTDSSQECGTWKKLLLAERFLYTAGKFLENPNCIKGFRDCLKNRSCNLGAPFCGYHFTGQNPEIASHTL